MKFGFELEKFLLKDGKPTVVPQELPHDACGWLVEFRSAPYSNPYEAIGSLYADMAEVTMQVKQKGFTLSEESFMDIPRGVKLEARRLYNKGVIAFQNLYGKNPSRLDHAGLHVSFTRPVEPYCEKNLKHPAQNLIWDFPTLFKKLDKHYAREIAAAKRVPGFYEIKHDGRIEYRSLPITVGLWDLAGVLYDFTKEL